MALSRSQAVICHCKSVVGDCSAFNSVKCGGGRANSPLRPQGGIGVYQNILIGLCHTIQWLTLGITGIKGLLCVVWLVLGREREGMGLTEAVKACQSHIPH